MRIFNRIRRKLLNELKIRSYVLYALGEILLIVVGILLALQINNWNQDRNVLIEKSKLLESLQQNFLSNQIEINDNLRKYAEVLDVVKLRIKNTGPDVQVPEKTTLDLLVKIGYVQLSFIFGGSAPALTQEKLTILSNQKLIIELNRFPIQHLRYKESEASVNELANLLREIHQKYIAILNEDIQIHSNTDDGLQPHDSNYLGWLRDRSNQNKSVESKWKIQQAIRELEHLKADNSRILKLVKDEMKRFTVNR